MKGRTVFWIILLIVIGLPLLIGISRNIGYRARGIEQVKFAQGGFERRYQLYIPRDLAKFDGPRPLVLVLHGSGGIDKGMIRITKGRFQDLADQHGFVVAYPNAVKRLWNFGPNTDPQPPMPPRDDLAYFQTVIAQIKDRAPIDPKRIFATGISRGGRASYFLGCKLPGKIRAIAPFSMPLPDYFVEDCKSGPPLGVAVFMGTKDPLVPYRGGLLTKGKVDKGTVLTTDQTVALFRARNGCVDGTATPRTYDDPATGTSVERTDWNDCSGAPVRLYKINGGGHTWPGGKQYLPKRWIGKVSNAINGADEVWDFFSSFK